MRFRLLFVLIAIGLFISLIEPVKYYFTDKELTIIPEYISYEQAIIDSLRNKIQILAEENRCSNFILPITKVQSNISSLPNITADLNLALAGYPGWRLSATSQQREEMRKRFDNTLQKWGSMLSSDDFSRMLADQRTAALRTDYSAEAVLSPLSVQHGNDLQLILTVNRERTGNRVFDARVTFANPETVLEWERELADRKDFLEMRKLRSRKGIYSALVFLSLAFISACALMITSYIAKKEYENELSGLITQIERRDDLINNGHYIAALELAERYLKFFPNDVDIKAFKERLLDYTNNDPKKAQIAYVEYLKIQTRLNSPVEGNYLSDGQKREITSLLPYHPKLAESFPQLISFEEEDRRRQELMGKLRQIRELINRARLTQSDLELRSLEKDFPPYPEITDLRREINERILISNDSLDQLMTKIQSLSLAEIKIVVKELITGHQDYKEAKNLLEALEDKKYQHGFELLRAEDNSKIVILRKNTLIIGRKEEGVEIDIAINDKHISRPHLKISIEAERVLIEDLDSAGGTYINGEAISKHPLRNNELLTLAKVIDLDYSIYRKNDKTIGGMMINLNDMKYLIVIDTIAFSIHKGKLSIMDGKQTLAFKEGVPIVLSDEKICFVSPFHELTIYNDIYRVQELESKS